MAVTSGHGNPKWTKEETLLALQLYFDCGGKPPSPSDRRVMRLSTLLQSLPIHAKHKKTSTFRNSDGVAFKLQNIRAVATGHGLQNVSSMDRLVWKEFGNDRGRVEKLAAAIVEGSGILDDLTDAAPTSDDSETFFEGRILTAVHKRRERAPRLRVKFLQKRLKEDTLCCDICNRADYTGHHELQTAIFEAHHIVPLGEGQQRTTRVEDLSLLCANCHRALHRLISKEKRWIDIAEAKRIIVT